MERVLKLATEILELLDNEKATDLENSAALDVAKTLSGYQFAQNITANSQPTFSAQATQAAFPVTQQADLS